VPCQLTTKALSSSPNPKAQKATKKKGNGGEKDRTRFFMKSKIGKGRFSYFGEWERNVCPSNLECVFGVYFSTLGLIRRQIMCK
jgi:hypothetical protein